MRRWSRCCSGEGDTWRPGLSAASAAACHAVRSVSCTPSRRRNAPRSVSLGPRDSRRTRSFSAPVHCFFLEDVMGSTLRDSLSHRERTVWPTPTSSANAFALTASGPINRRSIRLLNAVLYRCGIRQSTLTPTDGIAQPLRQQRPCDNYPDTGGELAGASIARPVWIERRKAGPSYK